MCGIAAVVCGSREGRLSALTAILAALAHRGRPGTLREISDAASLRCALGANRLPIVAPLTNTQPYVSRAGRSYLVFNGEVFNYRELWAELDTRGAAPNGDAGDTAVLGAALDSWGLRETLRRLVWEGAFIRVDTDTGALVAARDHLGIKPLYLTVHSGLLAFSSEIKGLLALGDGAEITPVAPGSWVSVDLGRGPLGGEPAQWRWWDVGDLSGEHHDPGVVQERTDELVRRAVELRVPDKPYAVALSGGLDSSLVLRLAMARNDRVTAYVLHRPGSPDLPYARRLCAQLDVSLTEVQAPEPSALRDQLTEIVGTVETWEWQVVNHAAPMGPLFSAVRQDGHDVVLTGEGADELFHGYTDPWSAVDGRTLHGERLRRLTSLHRTNCRRLDRMGMRYGVECRVPFLDRALTEHALTLPASVTVAGGRNKAPLRTMGERVLPAWLARRKKLSFARGAGYSYAAGEVPSVFGPTRHFPSPDAPPRDWAGLARYPMEEIFLDTFLAQGFGRAMYLRCRSV